MWLKNFRIRKLQTFVMVVTILLCGVLLGGAMSILSSLNKPFHELAKECDSAQALVYPYSTKDEDVFTLAKQLEKIDTVTTTVDVRQHYLTEEVSANGTKLKCFLTLREYNDKVFGKVRYVAGNDKITRQLKTNECAIPACVSNEYQINLGDQIKICTVSGDIYYTVKGIYADPYNASTAYDSSIIISKLPDKMTGNLQIYLYGDKNIRMSAIEETYQDTYHTQFPGQIHSVDDAISGSLLALKILGAMLIVIGGVMLIVSCLIINFMVRNAMLTDAKTIAVYKTMGYQTKDILGMYMMFYFVTSSLAIIVGLFFAKIFAAVQLKQLYQDIGMSPNVSMMMTGISCYLVIESVILLTVFCIVIKTRKVKPVYALRGMSNANSKRAIGHKDHYQGSFSAFGIAMRMILRNKKGMVGILVISIVTVIGINFGVISLDVANGMKDKNYYWLGIDKCNIMVTLSEDAKMADVEELLKNDTRIEKMIPCAYDSGVVILDWKKGMNQCVMYPFVYRDYSKVDLPVIKGRNPISGKEIAISGKMANDTGKTIGDYLDVSIAGTKKNFLITGLYQTYYNMGSACRFTMEAYDGTNRTPKYDTLSIYLKSNTDQQKMIADMEKLLGGYGKVLPRTEQFSSIMDLIMKPQQNSIPPMVVLALIIGATDIFGIVLLKNTKDEKTNCIYKCIGYSSTHLIMANLIYVMSLALISIAVALPVTILMYPKIMTIALGMFGFIEYSVQYNIGHLVICNSAVFGIFIISTLLSSRSVWKVNVRDLVIE
jgi:putative ABC transport system permease protein